MNTQVPGYETCVAAGDRHAVDVDVDGVAFYPDLGNRTVKTSGTVIPKGFMSPSGAKVRTMVCKTDATETFVAGAKFDQGSGPHLTYASLIWTWCNTAQTTPRRTARSSTSWARNRPTRWAACWSANCYTVGAGRLVRLSEPQTRHRSPRDAGSRPATTRPTISASARTTAPAYRCCSARTTSPATPITSSTVRPSCIDTGLSPLRRALPGYEMYYFTILGGLSQRSR